MIVTTKMHEEDFAEPVRGRNLDSAYMKERISGIIERLPDKQRKAVFLHYIEELSMREIGEQFSVTTTTATNWVQKGLRILRCPASILYLHGRER